MEKKKEYLNCALGGSDAGTNQGRALKKRFQKIGVLKKRKFLSKKGSNVYVCRMAALECLVVRKGGGKAYVWLARGKRGVGGGDVIAF